MQLFTAVIAGVTYLLHPEVLGTIQEDINPDAVLPVTLVTTEELSNPSLDDLLKAFETYDDVYSSEFAFALVEKPAANDTARRGISSRDSNGKQTYTIEVTDTPSDPSDGASTQATSFANLPTGPYILHGKELHQAYRVYEDELDAFTVGIVPRKHDSNDLFVDLGGSAENSSYKQVAVPSRLYFPAPSIRKPLSGLRYTIPEGFEVGGLPTYLSSENWTSLYPEDVSKNSEYVQLLLDQGAVIVGRTKDGQFAAGKDWVDATPPVNLRGDGKQLPGGSAAGAFSALTNYTWLENSISQGAFDGTMSQGAAYGLFALRSTADTASSKGIHASSPKFNSVGISGRSLQDIMHLIGPSFKLPWKATAQPKRIVYPTDFKDLLSEKQQSLMDEFVEAAEKLLKVKAEKISLADVWAKNPPSEAGKQSLDEYLGSSAYDAFCADFYHNYDEFRKAFKAKFGEEAYAEPTVAKQWANGAKVDDTAADEKLKVFASWFNENVAPTGKDSDKKAAVIVPVLGDNSKNLDGMKGLRPEILAPVLGAPQMDAPFAQIPIQGSEKDYLPFSAGMMGAKGDDIMIVQVMKRLFDIVDWRIHVDAGRLTYPVGNNSRGVDDFQQDPFPTPGPGAFFLAMGDDSVDSEL